MKMDKGLINITWLVYALIVFEILYMISPFAFFYYSAYGLPLRYLQSHTATAWLVQFILPHFSHSGSALVNLSNAVAWPLIIAGLLLFIAGFVQIYYAKFFKKREVTGGLYNYIRHPQYVSLAVLGLGTFLVYPRFIILIAFVTMLFLYYFLARYEEKECLNKFGQPYADYLNKTGMFLPRLNLIKTRSLPAILPEKGVSRALSIILLYIMIMATTIVAGYGIREYALSTIASYSDASSFVLSLTDMNKDEIRKIYEMTMKNDEAKVRISSGKKHLVYILPEEWHIPELPVSFQREHVMPENISGYLYKVLVTSVVSIDKTATGNGIIKNAMGFSPDVLVFVNMKQNNVVKVMDPPAAKWAGIPVPLF